MGLPHLRQESADGDWQDLACGDTQGHIIGVKGRSHGGFDGPKNQTTPKNPAMHLPSPPHSRTTIPDPKGPDLPNRRRAGIQKGSPDLHDRGERDLHLSTITGNHYIYSVRQYSLEP